MDAASRLEPTIRELIGVVERLCALIAAPADSERRPRLREVELELRGAVLRVGHAATQLVVDAYGTGRMANQRHCTCGGTQRFKAMHDRAMTDLHGGTLELTRAYYYCSSCRQGFLPLDEEVGLGPQELTPALADLVEWVGVVAPFEAAAGLLRRCAGVQVSGERVRRATERAGGRCLEESALEAEHALNPLQPEVAASQVPLPSAEVVRPYIMIDGGMVPTREGFREAKLGVCFADDDRVEQSERRTALLHKRFFGDIATAQAFGQSLYAAARQLIPESDGTGCEVLADGAKWIWNLKAEHLPNAAETVDWYHAKEHLFTTAHALYGQTPSATAWAEARADDLWHERSSAVLAALGRARPRSRLAREAITDMRRYLLENRHRMKYASRRRRGLLVGSGAIEGGIRYVLQDRLKRVGMRWSVVGARQVLALRLRWASDQWENRPTPGAHSRARGHHAAPLPV